MTGPELSAIRQEVRMSTGAFAAALGYLGSWRNRDRLIRRYEAGERRIPEDLARDACELLGQYRRKRGNQTKRTLP